MKKSGFSLIELIIVMAILAVLLGIGANTFTSSIKKSHDSAKKGNLKGIATALELYYSDHGQYPADDGDGGMLGCDNEILCTPGGPWQDVNDTLYMQLFPTDAAPSLRYYYRSAATNEFQLYARLENSQDGQIIITSYACNRTGSALLCNYGVSSGNTSP